ncbi:glycosyl hydrolase family 28-related protein [Mycolicibacterium baixiangningiae]|uniref:glycosyl hydrolase family 28-related protein n=1 Tax=Mycolicibacterium baixiangningiae TaxID=2761578 RepID=UPI0027DA4586|nr:glycosyl hydrolase family 28-related protein [Mycolicibacterium baixiangningiae]
MSGAALAVGIGMFLSPGIAGAEPAPEPSGAGVSADAGAPADTKPTDDTGPGDTAGETDDEADDDDADDTLDDAPEEEDPVLDDPVLDDEDVAPAEPVDEESDHRGSDEDNTDPAPEPELAAPAEDDDVVIDTPVDIVEAEDPIEPVLDQAPADLPAPPSEPEAEAPAQADVIPPAPAPADTPSQGVIAKLATAFGVGGTPAPVESPALWAVLAWARRQFAVATATTATPVSSTTSSSTPITTINVKDYGAIGDGITDDSAAIKAAQAALTSGQRLYFPEGDYRFAQQNPAGNAAIHLQGLSDVTVEFAPGARLLMDNLNANGHGTSHGIRVEGAASNVTILNATIEWKTRPSARSFGDGFSVLGWASNTAPPPGWTGSTGTVSNVSIINARVVNAPQTGAVFMGASDVTVTNFTAIGTLADGLHFNANRRVTVNGLVAQNTGDDGLAFVTYYHPSQLWTYGPGDGPFNQPGLGEWNNGGSVASNITVSGGSASGVRVQGGYDITISDVTVTGKDFGLQINSAQASGPGDWTSLASRDIEISDVAINGVQTGIVLATNNINGTENSMWWDFSGLTISDVTIHNSRNWSIAVETPSATTSKFAGLTLRNIYADVDANVGPLGGGNGGILLASLRDSTIDNVRLVSVHASDINVLGASQIRNQYDVADLPSSNLTIDDLVLEGPGRILIQDIAGVEFGDVESHGAHSSAVVLFRVKSASFDTITANLPGRGAGDGRGVQLLQVYDLDVENIEVTMDDHVGSSWWAIELGGGNPTEDIAGEGVRIENVTYVSDRDATGSDIVVQGGPYGPVNWYINATWLHQGEASPQWRTGLWGDTTPSLTS